MMLVILVIAAVIAAIYLAINYICLTCQSIKALFNKQLEKKVRTSALLRVISAAVALSGLLLALIVHIWDEVVTYTYSGGKIIDHSSYGKIDPVLYVLFILSTIMMIASIPFDYSTRTKGNGRARCVSVSIVSALTIAVFGTLVIACNWHTEFSDEHSPRFYKFDSPINSHSIVICEKVYGLFYSKGDIFQVDGEKAEKIGSFSTDEYLNQGNYGFEWTASQATVTYCFDSGIYESVTVKFAEL